MTTPDPRHLDVAAYALGVLTDTDAEQFEEHLVWCDECAAQLEHLLPATMALSQVDRDAYVPADESIRQGSLLDRMANVVALERRRAWAQRTLAVAAAIAILIVATLAAGYVGTRIGSGPSNLAGPRTGPSTSASAAANTLPTTGPKEPGIGGPEQPPGAKFSTSDDTSKARLDIFVDARPWGTQIALSLSNVTGPLNCQLVAVDRHGKRSIIGTWFVPENGYGTKANPEPLLLEAATAVFRSDLLRVQVVAVGRDAVARDLVGVAV